MDALIITGLIVWAAWRAVDWCLLRAGAVPRSKPSRKRKARLFLV